MATDVRAVERALLALPPEERAAVIHAGLLSLDGDDGGATDAELDATWRTEIDNRLEDVLHERVTLGTFESTRQRFAAEYPSTAR